MSFKTVSAIRRGRWLIDKQWAASHMPMVVKILQGETVDFGFERKEEDKAPKVFSHKAGVVYGVSSYTDTSKLPQGAIAMMTIAGPVTKYGDMCAWGSIDHVATVNRLANSPNISGIILNIDSPGGEAAGTAMLSDAIKAAASNKPVIAVIDDGIAASAAMWFASASSEIYTTQKTDMVGSVGVYTTIVDWYGYLEEQGLKVRDVYAPESSEKNLDYKQSLAGDDALLESELSVLAQEFISTVRKNRAGKLTTDEWTKGKMFFSKDASRIGLIDGQKTFNQVVKRMDQLIQNKQSSNQTNNMAFSRTLTAAKSESFEVVDGGFLIQEEQLNNIEATIEANDAVITTATASEAAAVATAATAAADLANANTRITELEAQVVKLENADGTQGANAEAVAQDEFENANVGYNDLSFQKELYSRVD